MDAEKHSDNKAKSAPGHRQGVPIEELEEKRTKREKRSADLMRDEEVEIEDQQRKERKDERYLKAKADASFRQLRVYLNKRAQQAIRKHKIKGS